MGLTGSAARPGPRRSCWLFSICLTDGAYRVCWVFTAPLELDVTALTGDPVACLSSRDDVVLLARTDRRAELPVGHGAPLTA